MLNNKIFFSLVFFLSFNKTTTIESPNSNGKNVVGNFVGNVFGIVKNAFTIDDRYDDLLKKSKEQEKKLNEFNSENSELQKNIEKILSEQAQLISEIKLRQALIHGQKEELNSLKSSQEVSFKELESLSVENKEFKQNQSKLTSDIDKLRQEIIYKDIEVSIKTSEISKLQEEFSKNLSSLAGTASDGRNELFERNEFLKKALESLNKELIVLGEDKKNANEYIDQLNINYEQIKSGSLDFKILHQTILSDLDFELSSKQLIIDNLTMKTSDLKKEIKNHEDGYNAANDQFDELNTTYQDKLIELEQDLIKAEESLNRIATESEAKLDFLRKTIAENESKKISQVDNFNVSCSSKEENSEKQLIIDNLTTKTSDLKKEIKNHEDGYNAANDQFDELNTTYQDKLIELEQDLIKAEESSNRIATESEAKLDFLRKTIAENESKKTSQVDNFNVSYSSKEENSDANTERQEEINIEFNKEEQQLPLQTLENIESTELKDGPVATNENNYRIYINNLIKGLNLKCIDLSNDFIAFSKTQNATQVFASLSNASIIAYFVNKYMAKKSSIKGNNKKNYLLSLGCGLVSGFSTFQLSKYAIEKNLISQQIINISSVLSPIVVAIFMKINSRKKL